MTRWYEPVGAAWIVQWLIFWGSWLVLPWLAWLGWRTASRWHTLARRRRAWRIVVLLGGLWFVHMRFVEPALIVVRTTPLQLGFDARVALISDYHLGLYKSPAFLERVVERLNAMELDAVLIAGDHVGEPDRPLVELLAPLRRLRHPAYSVPGNHDEQHPGPPLQQALREALVAVGVVPVEYTHAVLERFTIVGLGDRYAGKDDPAPLARAPRDRPIVVLLHNPDSAMQLPAGSAALVVAGHTHGGQVRLPWLYRYVIPIVHPFDRGLHDFAPVPVFVTSGLGEAGLPLRFLNPPVIDVLEIH
jgi:predicted MPP superfamily phosphohydrolase